MLRFRLIYCFLAITTLAGCAAPATKVRKPGASNKERDEAAKVACKQIWDKEPLAQRFEYCGILYWEGRKISVGPPKTDRNPTGCRPPSPPATTVLTGTYHSHRITPEPSSEDMTVAEKYPDLGHYLCSPSGIVRRFSAEEGTVIVQ